MTVLICGLCSWYSSVQPIAVVLCSGWKKAQVVYELLEEMKVNQTLHSIVTLLGLREDEAKAFKIPKNCESTSSALSACDHQGHQVFMRSPNSHSKFSDFMSSKTLSPVSFHLWKCELEIMATFNDRIVPKTRWNTTKPKCAGYLEDTSHPGQM